MLILFLEQYDPVAVHIIIPRTVIENARVNLRTRHSDPRILTPNVDPPHFTPSRKEDISLPPSVDTASEWVWTSKWAVLRDESLVDSDGWRFAQRWDTPKDEWASNPVTISPISRAGLVSQRRWVRVMKKIPAGQGNMNDVDSSEDEPELHELEFRKNTVVGKPVRNHPARVNSLGARLVGLVAGTSKGK
jgi:hypothetical protein